MAEEPTLPRLPAVSWNEETQSFSNNPRKRVRARGSSAASPFFSNNSSDPAVFSSDDDPALDNYANGGRRKKRYVGSWFHHQQQPASSDSAFEDMRQNAHAAEPSSARLPSQPKRQLRRQLDSGVWMGSDGTDDGLLDDLPLPAEPKLPLPLPAVAAVPKPQIISPAEAEARRIIQDCVDNGREAVDLAALNLTSLSNATILPLNDIDTVTVVAPNVPFEYREPDMKLFLARNPLERFPLAILDLQFLTFLSLRGCGLEELPPAIGKLRTLEGLHLAQNQFRHLPYELLDLMSQPNSLRSVTLSGNKFHEANSLPESVEAAEWKRRLEASKRLDSDIKAEMADFVLRLADCGEESSHFEKEFLQMVPKHVDTVGARYLARTPVQYTDSTGFVHSEFSLDKIREQPESVETEKSTNAASVSRSSALSFFKSSGRSLPTSPDKASRVPSLMELAARTCYHSSDLDYLPEYIPESLPHLRKLLERAIQQRDEGGYQCWRCKKTMVTPAAQWLEWWQVVELARGDRHHFQRGGTEVEVTTPQRATFMTEEDAVPFLRMGCSWRCGPPDTLEVGRWATHDNAKDVKIPRFWGEKKKNRKRS